MGCGSLFARSFFRVRSLLGPLSAFAAFLVTTIDTNAIGSDAKVTAMTVVVDADSNLLLDALFRGVWVLVGVSFAVEIAVWLQGDAILLEQLLCPLCASRDNVRRGTRFGSRQRWSRDRMELLQSKRRRLRTGNDVALGSGGRRQPWPVGERGCREIWSCGARIGDAFDWGGVAGAMPRTVILNGRPDRSVGARRDWLAEGVL